MKMKIMALLALLILILFSQIDIVNAGIQINSNARKGETFLSNTIVHYIITDPAGRKLGYDPLSDKNYNDFPKGGGSYGDGGIDDTWSAEAIISPADGNYTIEIIGDSLMEFSIEVAISWSIISEGMINFNFRGLTDKGLTSKFEMTYNSDPSKPAGSVVRVASLSSLKQDIALSRKIGWIDNDGIMMSLYKKAEAIEKSLARDDKNTAKNQLDALINEVNAQKGKHIKDEAIKILLEDVQYLMEHL